MVMTTNVVVKVNVTVNSLVLLALLFEEEEEETTLTVLLVDDDPFLRGRLRRRRVGVMLGDFRCCCVLMAGELGSDMGALGVDADVEGLVRLLDRFKIEVGGVTCNHRLLLASPFNKECFLAQV